jgi:uncharacterized membrane protein YkoI
MNILPKCTALFLALGLLVAGNGASHADDDDHDRARRALEEGSVRPLAEILQDVRDELGGEVVGVELEREDGRYVYEFEVITPGGRLREINVDALTAEILKIEDD